MTEASKLWLLPQTDAEDKESMQDVHFTAYKELDLTRAANCREKQNQQGMHTVCTSQITDKISVEQPSKQELQQG